MSKTKPIPGIIPNPILEKEILEVLDRFSGILTEVRNFGTHVLKWSCEVSRGGYDSAALIMFFRNILEILDAISSLVKKSSIEPSKILLRTLLENLLYIDYMTTEETEKRALSFFVWDIHRTIRKLKKLDQSSEQGKQFLRQIKKDRLVGMANINLNVDIVSFIKDKEARLQENRYFDIEEEYQRTASTQKNPPWYALYSGPKNLKELADKLQLAGVYDNFFRELSEFTHGTDIIRGKISKTDKVDEVYISQIRLPFDAPYITSQTISFSIDVFQAMIRYFVPDRLEDYSIWYVKELKNDIKWVGQCEIKPT